MTNKQALQSQISNSIEPPDNLLDKVLIDNDVDGSATYSKGNSEKIELCTAYIYKVIATEPNFKQGSLAISNIDANTLLKIANNIFKKYGKLDEVTGVKIDLQF